MTYNEQFGQLSVVGIGPGDDCFIAPAAHAVLQKADSIAGYSKYIQLVKHLIGNKDIIQTGMTGEIERVRAAIDAAQTGKHVALISSGDAGVYGMLSLVYQVLEEMGWTEGNNPNLEVIPGISAVNSCAALSGSPLGDDYCCISLSDLLTPWDSIRKKIRLAAEADFVIGFYNPASKRRRAQIAEAREILLNSRLDTTPVALITSAYRNAQKVVITDIEHFLEFEIGMNTTVIIGSSQTYVFDNKLVTPRGYSNKYSWDGEIIEGQQRGVSLK